MSLNDPQWGKNKNDGPPDLDEIMRKLNQKIAGLFGGKPGGSDESRPPGPPRAGAIGGGLLVLGAVGLVVWLGTGFYIVEEGKRGVVLRLGKYSETTSPGPRWHWPYPFESREMVNISAVRTVEVGYRNSQKSKMPQEALMLTKDKNIVDVQFAVQYDVKDPEDFLFNNRMDADAVDSVRQVAETAIREVVGKSDMDFVLNEGRGEISSRVQRLMQQILDRYRSGIQVRSVTMQNAQPPEQVQSAFDDAVRARQDREKFKNEGETYRNARIPEARGLAQRLIEEANGHKARVVANAKGDTARFREVLQQYEKAPQVTRERIYLETLQQIMERSSKIMVDQKSGNGSLLYLPLDKLMQAPTAGSESVSVRVPDAAAAAPAPSPDVRSRDALRTREAR
jgi:membrane protease subunit HflK